MIKSYLWAVRNGHSLVAGHADFATPITRPVPVHRRSRSPVGVLARSSSGRSANGLNTTEVREWARAQGIEVKDRGRVPADLVVKFKASTSQQG